MTVLNHGMKPEYSRLSNNFDPVVLPGKVHLIGVHRTVVRTLKIGHRLRESMEEL
jgi:hypothetical protein